MGAEQGVCRRLPPVAGGPLCEGGGRSRGGIVECDYFLTQSGHGHWSQPQRVHAWRIMARPTPVVALNRAIAIGEVRGASAALAFVDELDLDNYHPFHATRADLLRRLGRNGEAAAAYERAAALAPTGAEQDFLKQGGRGSR